MSTLVDQNPSVAKVGEILMAAHSEEPRICDVCRSGFSICERICDNCKHKYCPHYASKIDTMYCVYCFHDFVMEDTYLTKQVQSKSLNGRKVFTRTMKARHIVFKGEAWMFAQRRVVDMDDMELTASIEYHREIYDQMLEERELRSIKKNRLALKKMIRTSSDQFNPTQDSGTEVGHLIGMRSTTVKTTRTTKTRIVNQGGMNPQIAMQALVNMLKAKGMTEDAIKATLTAMVSKP